MKQETVQAVRRMREQALQWGVDLSTNRLDLLVGYAELLAGYRQANVIGTKNPAEIVLSHLTDALSCFLTGHIAGGKRLVDVGTGGGLPGIPLKAACPDLNVSLLEATSKKVRFLEEVIDTLALSDAETINERVELAGKRGEYRDRFEVATVRAVAELPVVVEYCAPLVEPGGHIVAMRGALAPEELEAARRAAGLLGAELETIRRIEFRPDMVQKERHLVVFRKTSSTPDRFPRRVGLAKQRPLGMGRKQ